jgi:citrate synthase
MSDSVKLTYQNKEFEFPLIQGSENEKGIDIKSLRAQTGLITFDPGYKNTGSCKSNITYLNGEEGILRHRGYSIEDLCGKASFFGSSIFINFWGITN